MTQDEWTDTQDPSKEERDSMRYCRDMAYAYRRRNSDYLRHRVARAVQEVRALTATPDMFPTQPRLVLRLRWEIDLCKDILEYRAAKGTKS